MREAAPIVLEGLLKLECQEYDSTGICTVEKNKVHIRRSKGKLANLVRLIAALPLRGTIAMGHIRTATQGKASEINAHPHKAGPVVLVHNGTIENYQELKFELVRNDHTFKSETDSEVIAHLIEQKMYGGSDFEDAVRAALLELKGTFALCLISETEPGKMIAVTHGLPLIVGIGDGEYFIASEIHSLTGSNCEIIYLEDNELAVFRVGSSQFTTLSGRSLKSLCQKESIR
jgi:glucosamine--fructose-6-phosphate aminotransferase (isomerizing)